MSVQVGQIQSSAMSGHRVDRFQRLVKSENKKKTFTKEIDPSSWHENFDEFSKMWLVNLFIFMPIWLKYDPSRCD